MYNNIRWRATVYYRTEHGLTDVTHDLSEIEELHDVVERGPHWDTIAEIRVERAGTVEGEITVEEAEKL